MNKKIGILLINLGTPDAPTTAALRRYLAEFLSDPRVVEIPAIIWKPLLHGIILNLRPQRSAALYKKIWSPEGSPLLVYSQKLADALQQQLNNQNIKIALGMRYGNPSIANGLKQLQQAGCQKIIVLPLYPQYSAATTGSTFDAIAETLKKWRVVPELHFINEYFDNPQYINAIAETIRQHWQQQGKQSFLLFSFHGLPQRCSQLGDPYEQQCRTTARLITEKLNLAPNQWQLVFQSRFGRAEWLQPYCDATLCELPKRGIDSVDVICPGFAVDCLETLEEINQQNRGIFLKAGGKNFSYIPALNATSLQVKLLISLISQHLQ